MVGWLLYLSFIYVFLKLVFCICTCISMYYSPVIILDEHVQRLPTELQVWLLGRV